LRWAIDLGGMRLRPYRSEYRRHSTPWESGSSASSFAPLVGLLVPFNLAAARTPPGLDQDFWFLAAEFCDVFFSGCDGAA